MGGINEDDQDPDGVIPDDLDDPKSPIDGLQQFDWGSADAELEEFMASGSEDDSDTSSVASGSSSRSHKSNLSVRGRKHPRDETDEEETDEESSLAKKQRLARVRTTGLKTVKTPHSATSESSLPTPEITGEEEATDETEVAPPEAEDDGDVDDDDLEAEMMAEFERGDWEEQPQDDYGIWGGEDEDDDGGG